MWQDHSCIRDENLLKAERDYQKEMRRMICAVQKHCTKVPYCPRCCPPVILISPPFSPKGLQRGSGLEKTRQFPQAESGEYVCERFWCDAIYMETNTGP